MYDELIKKLRYDSASALQNCEFDFVHDWMLKAADAIEKLQKQLREEKVDNINLTGWLAEKHRRLDDAEIENIKLKEEFAKYRGKHRWISVTERLPEANDEVLVYLFKSQPYIAWVDEEGRWETNNFYVDHDYLPTHWTPLPKPPESDG